ncbi:MAG: hypothetical protein LBI33_05905 [Propionibacteriaceae bacterium]|jgi:hypothetical protein|nr:hypothetical protein [Propionibacteriaceae bacterium]
MNSFDGGAVTDEPVVVTYAQFVRAVSGETAYDKLLQDCAGTAEPGPRFDGEFVITPGEPSCRANRQLDAPATTEIVLRARHLVCYVFVNPADLAHLGLGLDEFAQQATLAGADFIRTTAPPEIARTIARLLDEGQVTGFAVASGAAEVQVYRELLHACEFVWDEVQGFYGSALRCDEFSRQLYDVSGRYVPAGREPVPYAAWVCLPWA